MFFFEQDQYENELITCWLCGGNVPKPNSICPLKEKISSVCLGYPEAEHALFLKYGYLFLSIPNEIFLGSMAPWIKPNNSIKNKIKTSWEWNDTQYDSWLLAMKNDYNFQIKLEMRQSHRLCNQLKNQINFIRFTGGEQGQWVIKKDLYDYYKETVENTVNNDFLTEGGEYQGYKVTGKETVFKNDRLLKSLNDLIKHLNCEVNPPECILSYESLPLYAKNKISEETFKNSSKAYKYVITRISTKFVKVVDSQKMEQSFNQAFDIFSRERNYTKNDYEKEASKITDISYEATPGIESSVAQGKLKTIKEESQADKDISEGENNLNKIQEELYENNDVKEPDENDNDILIGDLSRDGIKAEGTQTDLINGSPAPKKPRSASEAAASQQGWEQGGASQNVADAFGSQWPPEDRPGTNVNPQARNLFLNLFKNNNRLSDGEKYNQLSPEQNQK